MTTDELARELATLTGADLLDTLNAALALQRDNGGQPLEAPAGDREPAVRGADGRAEAARRFGQRSTSGSDGLAEARRRFSKEGQS